MNLNKVSLFVFKCVFFNFLIFLITKFFVSIYLNKDIKVTKAQHQIQQELSSSTEKKFSNGINLFTSFINSLDHKFTFNNSSSLMSLPEIKIKLSIFIFFILLSLLYFFSICSRAPPNSLYCITNL